MTELSNIENLKNLTDNNEKSKNKDILSFVVIQNGNIVYASQIFCKQQKIENLKLGGENKLLINKFFRTDISEIIEISASIGKLNKQIGKKKVIMADGKEVNIFSKIIQWDNEKAIQLFISE